MNQPPRPAARRANRLAVAKWWFLAGGTALAGILALTLYDQTRIEVVLINRASQPLRYNEILLHRETSRSGGIDPVVPDEHVLLTNFTLPADGQLRTSLQGLPGTLLQMSYSCTSEVPVWVKTNIPTWGARITIDCGLNSNGCRQHEIILAETALRKWVSANRNWIPLPGSWVN